MSQPVFPPPARLLSATALACASFTPAFAQVDETAISLDPIIVRDQDAEGDAADRATAVYVSEGALERARMGDVRDLFEGLSSVSVGGGIPMSQKIFVNGIDIVNMSTTIDGAMQNNRTFHHSSATVFDPGLLKTVRVDPGVAAADAGPNAVAGAVVLETIDAADFLADGDNFGGTLRLSYGGNGNTFGQALTLAGRAEGFEFLAYGRNMIGDDYTDGDGDTVAGTAADMQSGLLKVAYESEAGHRVELSGQRVIDDADRPWRADMSGIVGGRDPETRNYDTERNSYVLSYEFTQGGLYWNPSAMIGYSDARVNVAEPFGSKSTASTLSAKIENTIVMSLDDTITMGVDYYDKASDYDDSTDSDLNENAQNVGLYAQARLAPTERLSLSAGLRYDMEHFEGVNGFKDDVSGWSGNVSASYFLLDTLALRAGYSSVFGGLQLEDSYQFWGPVYGSWDYDDLEPSRSQNYSVGFDWYPILGLTLSGEYFEIAIDDARHLGETHDIDSKGINLGAAYSWDQGSARLTYTDAKVTADGKAEDSYVLRGYGTPIGQLLAFQVQQGVPQWDMLFGGVVNMAWDQEGEGSWASSDLDGYTVVDLFAEYAPARFSGLTLRVQVNNLFDTQYADRASYGNDFADITATSEPGRSIGLELIAQF